MRYLVPALVFASSVSACGMIAGLDGYSESSSHAITSQDARASEDAAASDGVAANGDDAPGDDTDASGGDAWSSAPDAALSDGAPDDSPSLGAGDAIADAAAIDARPPCNGSTCPGCCDSEGNCTSGSSSDTCGVGGETCKSCGSGQSCASGACEQTVVDASPPPACVASSCKCGIAQSGCCKNATTCGCAYPFAPCL